MNTKPLKVSLTVELRHEEGAEHDGIIVADELVRALSDVSIAIRTHRHDGGVSFECDPSLYVVAGAEWHRVQE